MDSCSVGVMSIWVIVNRMVLGQVISENLESALLSMILFAGDVEAALTLD